MDINSMIPIVQALSPATPIVTVLAKGIFATIFVGKIQKLLSLKN